MGFCSIENFHSIEQGIFEKRSNRGIRDMSHQRNSRGCIGTDNSFSCRVPANVCKSFSRVGVLVVLAAFATLILLACLDDSDRPSSISDQLRKNAENFEYSIGNAGGTMTLATVSEPLTLNPALAEDSASSNVLGYVFEGLTEVSWLTDQVEPALAESWTRSQDGLVWIFSLRKDVVWHDGTPFTAHDVEFTFNGIIYNKEIDSTDRAAFNFRFLDEDTGVSAEKPMTVTALNDYTVLCVLPVPFATFLRSMATNIYPKHILKPHVDAGTFARVWNIDTDPAEVIGTGPFTIESYTPERSVVLRRNPNYWLRDGQGRSLPYLERIVHIIVPDFETELARFKAGDADIHYLAGEDFAELEPLQTQGNFKVHRRGPGFGSAFLVFNMNPDRNPDTMNPYVAEEKLAWFQNVEFRRAVAHSVDKDRIIRDVQHGLGYPQWSSISPAAGDFHNPEVRMYEYDIAEANRILDALGWIDTDGDGIREDTMGNTIVFSLVTNTQNSVREKIGMIIQEGLGNIGVGVDYSLLGFGDVVSRLTSSYDWEAVVIGLTGGPDPHGSISTWHSSEGLHLWYPNQQEPATPWEAEIDDTYVRASQELDHSRRVELYHRAQEIVAENVPLIYTTHSERISAVRNVFGNTTPTLYGLWDIRYLYRTDL